MTNQTLLMYRGNNGQHVNVAIWPDEMTDIAAILPEILDMFQKDVIRMWGGGASQPKWGIPEDEVKAIIPEIEFMHSGKRVKLTYNHPRRTPNERQYHIETLPNLVLLEV